MKDILKKVEFFTFYDKTGIEKHLEQMASVGWLLEKMSAFRWTYRRIAPKKIHFSVSYYAAITDFEPEPTEEQQTFNEFCEHSGWKLATQTVQMQVFYNENDDPVPIETDPVLEVENIHRSVKKTVLVSYFLMLFLGFIMGVSFISTMLGDPILLLSSSIRLFTGIWCIAALVYSLTELITYFTWRRKAKKLSEQGVFLETRGHRKLGFAIVVFMLVSVVLYLISLANTGLQFYMTAYLLILLAGFPLVNGVKSFLKKKKVKAGTNKALTFAASFTLAFVLVGALTAVTILGIRNGAFESDLKELPFTIGELLDVDDSDYIKTRGKEDSIILGQYRSSQHPNTYEHSPTMHYTITEVKMPFLYDFVADTLYHHYDEWKGWNSAYEYKETDEAAWGADKAWELYRNGETDNAFLVCYDKYILEISVDWELTAEQKQLIGNKICEE
ncbi:MAG: DUF2812 domain-containing protein [Ruminococcaceae bacterium]|nr:DUF2812 domain-containing protein [Oscillospiraceae bacterium]